MLILNCHELFSYDDFFGLFLSAKEQSPAATNGDVLQKKVFLEISQNSQENTCAGVSFLQLFIKKESLTLVFSCEFWEHFLRTPFFTEHLRVAVSVKPATLLK